VLADAGIDCFVLDNYTSVIEGSIGAIPRRLMVDAGDYDRALRALSDAGEEIASDV